MSRTFYLSLSPESPFQRFPSLLLWPRPIPNLLAFYKQLDEDKQDIFFNSFLDNLEMEVEDKTVYDDGRQYAEDALSQCEAFESESDREEFLADMFASLKTLVEAGSHVASDNSEE